MGFKALSTTRSSATSTVSRQATVVNTTQGFAVSGSAIKSNTTISTEVVTPGQGTDVTPVSGGVAITSVNYLNANGSISTANAVSTSGGNIKINGTGFTSPMTVIVGTTTISNANVTVANSTAIIASLGSASPGNVSVYAFTSGNTGAVLNNGVFYSGAPSWTTTTVSFQNNSAANVQLVASSDSTLTYTLQAGSSLPTGISLISTGYLSGTPTGYSTNTSSTAVIVATDNEGQATQQTITWSVAVADPQFNYVSLLLNGDTGTNLVNAATNNTFLDSSTNNYPVTRAGNTTQGTFSPYSQTGWSNYFDGTGDYLTVADNAAFEIGLNQDFTIECWVNFYNLSGSGNCVLGKGASGVYQPYYFYAMDNNRLYYYSSSNGSTWNIANGVVLTTSLTKGVWYHVAVSRQGTNTRLFLNGALINTIANSGAALSDNALPFSVGGRSDGTEVCTAYISNVRFVKGTALYTSAFTPSITPLTAVVNTQLLTCQNNRFIDNSTNNFTITKNGDTSVQAFSPFAPANAYAPSTNGGSAYFDGTGDNLTYGGAAGPSGTEDFTFEFWWYFINGGIGGSFPRLFETTTANGFQVYLSGGTLTIGPNGGGTLLSYSVSTFVNQWAHICITRSGSAMRLFVNGVLRGYTASGGTNFAASTSYRTFSEGGGPIGYMSDLRTVRGSVVSAYSTAVTTTGTTVFTPPTTPLTAVANTALLCSFTNGGIVDAHSSMDLETVADAQLSTVVKKYGTASMSFNGSSQYLKMPPTSNTFIFGTGDFTVEYWIYLNGNTATYQHVCGNATTGSGFGFGFTGSLKLYMTTSTTGYASSGTALSTGQWYHVAFVRQSGTVKFYLNGTLDYNAGSVTTNITELGGYIGGQNAQYYTNCYIDDLRITKGFARYTANFTPPDSAFQGQ